MLRKYLIIILIFLAYGFSLFSQINPRLMDDRYVQTIFFDDFSTFQLSNWSVEENWMRDYTCNIWVNSSSTVSVSNGNLQLTMLHSPGYTVTQYTGKIISANYISGEIRSLRSFRYGVFECRAKFASQLGAFPSFWCISENDQMDSCSRTDNEIDFVELKAQNSQPTLDIGIFYHHRVDNCVYVAEHSYFLQPSHAWGNLDIFKCIWSPEKYPTM